MSERTREAYAIAARRLPLFALLAAAASACEGAEGPRGPAGPRGAQGPPGLPGATWEPATYVIEATAPPPADVWCNPGDLVTGGGCLWEGDVGASASAPYVDEVGELVGWVCDGSSALGEDVTVYVVCLTVE